MVIYFITDSPGSELEREETEQLVIWLILDRILVRIFSFDLIIFFFLISITFLGELLKAVQKVV